MDELIKIKESVSTKVKEKKSLRPGRNTKLMERFTREPYNTALEKKRDNDDGKIMQNIEIKRLKSAIVNYRSRRSRMNGLNSDFTNRSINM
jgi:hypothetical protein